MSDFHRVGAFHEKFGLDNVTYRGASPRGLPPDVEGFRLNFMLEELRETATAAGFQLINDHDQGHRFIPLVDPGPQNIPQIADGLIDLAYVTLGTAHLHRLPWDELFIEVQKANMEKRRAKKSFESTRGHVMDVVKPAGWQPPNIEKVLRKYGWRG